MRNQLGIRMRNLWSSGMPKSWSPRMREEYGTRMRVQITTGNGPEVSNWRPSPSRIKLWHFQFENILMAEDPRTDTLKGLFRHIYIKKGQIQCFNFSFFGWGLRVTYNSDIFEKLRSPPWGFKFLSNSTPTCKPNSTSVGLSRSWLCFPTEGRRKKKNKEGRITHT